jgi:hypothetical protein
MLACEHAGRYWDACADATIYLSSPNLDDRYEYRLGIQELSREEDDVCEVYRQDIQTYQSDARGYRSDDIGYRSDDGSSVGNYGNASTGEISLARATNLSVTSCSL